MSLDPALPEPHSTPPKTDTGFPLPLGPYIWDGGINFSLFSRHATQVWLELYDNPWDAIPRHRFSLTEPRHRTGDLWHIWVQGLEPGQLYGYRADGPYVPADGHRFNPYKLLLDPYAAAITHLEDWDFRRAQGYDAPSPQTDLSFSTENNAGTTPKCVVTKRRTGWDDPNARALGCYLPVKDDLAVLPLFNAGREAVDFDLPPLTDGRRWHRKADTALPSPDDITLLGATIPLDQQSHYTTDPQSSVVLVAPE